MPTTSNFGWTTPADTDLVKDGAAAIRTLGNGIDTSLVDLKGGTTGQVLSKATNTDLDYTWVTPNVGDITEVQAGTGISVASGTGPIPVVTNSMATTIDAKGDLIVGTGADTFARLAVGGTNGDTLQVDSSTATGLKWAAPSGGANWTLSNTGGTTLSGSATVTVNITAADKIMVIVSGASSASAASQFQIRFNSDTANNYYQYGGSYQYNSTYSAGIGGSIGTDYSEIRAVTMSSNAASLGRIFVRLDGGNASGLKSFISFGTATTSGGDSQVHNYLGGYYNSTSTITSVSVISSTGNFDAGTIFIYTSS